MRDRKVEHGYDSDLPYHRENVRRNTRAGDFHYDTEVPFIPPSKPKLQVQERPGLPPLGSENYRDLRTFNPEYDRRDDLVSAEEKTECFFNALRESPNFKDLNNGQIFGLLRDSFFYDHPGAADEDFQNFFMQSVENVFRDMAIREQARKLAREEQEI